MFQLVHCVGGSLKNLCHFEMGEGGLANADVIRGGRSMLTVAAGGGVKFAKILLTSYVNAPLILGIFFVLGNHQIMYTIYLKYQCTNTGKEYESI